MFFGLALHFRKTGNETREWLKFTVCAGFARKEDLSTPKREDTSIAAKSAAAQRCDLSFSVACMSIRQPARIGCDLVQDRDWPVSWGATDRSLGWFRRCPSIGFTRRYFFFGWMAPSIPISTGGYRPSSNSKILWRCLCTFNTCLNRVLGWGVKKNGVTVLGLIRLFSLYID